MQAIQLCASDEYHLRQRNKIETLFSLLKGQYNLVTSKARSLHGFLIEISQQFKLRNHRLKQDSGYLMYFIK